ncbi:hypothetical protein [Mesorhizobium sp. M1E.F.Ca.ET.063.01.1.1]|uniref:hypothetical protein n=1 Tax=Mesorhizobium sp. M1E.F.Ca.ET.063.01.1.1 TaxID=2496750 RepID=UPI000FCC283A|nr:hypothetical protein [Mesorhizobium sp. M1E.F.Ca.ET.063.01.1.1]RUW85584.1 hypothetical protein EOA29_04160 [Mesorhizobium sp. M1E.F.Ca.ET.063.01.1.1]
MSKDGFLLSISGARRDVFWADLGAAFAGARPLIASPISGKQKFHASADAAGHRSHAPGPGERRPAHFISNHDHALSAIPWVSE